MLASAFIAWWILMGFEMSKVARKEFQYSSDQNLAKNFINDWGTQPFTEMVTTEETFCPETHPYELFYYFFEGEF